MGIVEEFKQFVARGNVIDMAVGVIVGLAFGQIVSSLVSDVLMPPIGLLIGGVDFSELMIVLREAENGVAAVTINYGIFIKRVVDFLIIAMVVFAAIKMIARLQHKKETAPAEPPAPSNEEKLLAEIRDLLKSK
ncbi:MULTISPECIES: large-conductance mechanosensitive channel protein MscL [unclassified Thioalkalivibrio]|uniref:large-conductance mechanosensitive channel protein MscL n=1 Tax=unclassified Thioalkalivibrio TaxID=2621013 RepID=UPI0003791CBC|nr:MULTISPECIES: large-conductance mechanosensitive channel protein MscL [unclassified Thioalkalivibrio]